MAMSFQITWRNTTRKSTLWIWPKKDWKLEMAERKYDESLADENPYEPKLNNGTSSFPYDLKQLIETRASVL